MGTHARLFSQTLLHESEVKRARKKEVPIDGLSQPDQNTISINILWYYFTRYGKSTMKFN